MISRFGGIEHTELYVYKIHICSSILKFFPMKNISFSDVISVVSTKNSSGVAKVVRLTSVC